MRHFRSIIYCIVGFSLAGCAKYEFSIIDPTEHAMLITRQERMVQREPVTYFFVDQSSRLGIRIENPTDQALTIRGEESYVVTPEGRSDPMRGGTIAPHTWSSFTIPPLERVYSGGGSGVSFGIGMGTWSGGSGGGVGVGTGIGYDPFYGGSGPSDVVAWRWTEGQVRLHLVYETTEGDARRIEQDFTFERRKVSN